MDCFPPTANLTAPRLVAAHQQNRRRCFPKHPLGASGVAHEFRTTVDPALVGADDVEGLRALLSRMGVQRYVLQEARRA